MPDFRQNEIVTVQLPIEILNANLAFLERVQTNNLAEARTLVNIVGMIEQGINQYATKRDAKEKESKRKEIEREKIPEKKK